MASPKQEIKIVSNSNESRADGEDVVKKNTSSADSNLSVNLVNGDDSFDTTEDTAPPIEVTNEVEVSSSSDMPSTCVPPLPNHVDTSPATATADSHVSAGTDTSEKTENKADNPDGPPTTPLKKDSCDAPKDDSSSKNHKKKKKDRDRVRERERDREKERNRDKERDREKNRDRERDKNRERDHGDKERDKSRDKHRHEREKQRHKDYKDGEKEKEKIREHSKHRDRDRDKERTKEDDKHKVYHQLWVFFILICLYYYVATF